MPQGQLLYKSIGRCGGGWGDPVHSSPRGLLSGSVVPEGPRGSLVRWVVIATIIEFSGQKRHNGAGEFYGDSKFQKAGENGLGSGLSNFHGV